MGGHTRATRSSLSLPYVDGIAGAVVMVPRSTLRAAQVGSETADRLQRSSTTVVHHAMCRASSASAMACRLFAVRAAVLRKAGFLPDRRACGRGWPPHCMPTPWQSPPCTVATWPEPQPCTVSVAWCSRRRTLFVEIVRPWRQLVTLHV